MSDVTDPEELALRKTMKLERYAEILAHMMFFGDILAEEVARRFGLSRELWRAVDRAWTSELALGIKRQQRDQALRFSAAFHKRRQRLEREQPSIDMIGDAPTAPRPAAPSEASEPQQRPLEKPSFMLHDPKPAGSWASAATGAQSSQASSPAPPPPQRTSTASMPAVSPEAMFAAGDPDGAPDPLPFVEGVASNAALQSAVQHAEAVQGPKVVKPASLGLTAPTDGQRIAEIARRLLPFEPAAAAPADTAPPARESFAPPAPKATPVPATSPSADDTPALTLEQHASLLVELELYPEQESMILRRYGLSPEQHERTDAFWRSRLAQDAHMQATWDEVSGRYRAWLTRATT